MNINQRVQKLLANSKLTQKELSAYISVAPSTLNNWIKLGRSIPSEYIIPICEFFDISLEHLLTGKENKLDKQNEIYQINNREKELLKYFRELSNEEQVRLLARAEVLAEQEQAKFKENVS